MSRKLKLEFARALNYTITISAAKQAFGGRWDIKTPGNMLVVNEEVYAHVFLAGTLADLAVWKMATLSEYCQKISVTKALVAEFIIDSIASCMVVTPDPSYTIKGPKEKYDCALVISSTDVPEGTEHPTRARLGNTLLNRGYYVVSSAGPSRMAQLIERDVDELYDYITPKAGS